MTKRRTTYLNPFQIFLEIVILILFIGPMFTIHYFVGLFYLLAISIAFWKDLLFKRKNMALMIILGTFLSYFSGLFIPYILGSYLAGDIVSAVIMLIVALLIWRKAIKLKLGKK